MADITPPKPIIPQPSSPTQDFSGDYQAHLKSLNDPAVKATQIVQSAPELAAHPHVVMALAQTPNVDGHTLANSAKTMIMADSVHKFATAGTKANPGASHGSSWFSSLLHSVGRILTDGAAPPMTTDGSHPNVIADWGKGLVGLAGGAIKRTMGDMNIGASAVTTAGPSERVNPSAQAGVMKDVTNVGNAIINPVFQFNSMSHSLAFYESLRSRYGTAYATNYFMLNMLPAIATKGALGIGETGLAEEVAAASTQAEKASVIEKAMSKINQVKQKNLEKKVETTSLSPEEEAQLAELKIKNADAKAAADAKAQIKANRKARFSGTLPEEEQLVYDELKQKRASEAGLNEAEKIRFRQLDDKKQESGLSKLRRATAFTTNTIATPLKVAARVGSVLFRPGQDTTMNLMYQATALSAEDNPDLKQLWEQTRDGSVVDKYGRRIGTNGQVLMELLGAHPGDMAFQLGSGAVDFYTKYLGSDPMGAVGKVIGQSRTAEGFTKGFLAEHFGGMGMNSAEDVYRIADEYQRVKAAFQYMATHGLKDILNTFRGTYDMGTKEGIKAVADLAKATTVEEVIKIHADLAEGIGMVRKVAPSMSMYELLKARIPGDLIVGDVLNLDYAIRKSMEEAVKNNTPFNITPQSLIEAAAQNPSVRARASFGRWLVKQFTRNATYINEVTKAWESKIIIPGSKNALAAISDSLRGLSMPEHVIDGVIEALYHAKPEDYGNVLKSIYFYASARRLVAGLGPMGLADSVLAKSLQDIRDHVEEISGVDTAGSSGAMVPGDLGPQLSETIATNNISKYSGVGSTHMGSLRFPDARTIIGLSSKARQMIMNLAGTSIGSSYELLQASNETLSTAAEYSNANIDNLHGQLDEAMNKNLGGISKDTVFSPNSQGGHVYQENVADRGDAFALTFPGTYKHSAVDSYKQTMQDIKDMTVSTAKTKFEKNQEFVATVETVRQQLFGTRKVISAFEEYRTAVSSIKDMSSELGQQAVKEINDKLAGTGFNSITQVTTRKLAELRGEERALSEASAHLLSRIERSSITMDMVKQHVADYERVFNAKRVLDEKAINKLADDFKAIKAKNPRFLNPWQHAVEGMNKLISQVFVPLALTSGGWAIRVSASEAMLNSLRSGGWSSLESRVMTGIAKHESVTVGDYKKFFESKNHNLVLNTVAHALVGVREIMAGAVLGVERALVNRADIGSQRMIDNFTSAILRHNGHLPMGVHDSGTALMDDSYMHKMAIYGRDENGETLKTMMYRGRDFDHINANVGAGIKGYVTALFEHLTRISRDEVLQPTMQELSNILRDMGAQRMGADAVTMTTQELIANGARSVTTKEAVDALMQRLEKKAYETIQSLPEAARMRFERDTATLKSEYSYRGKVNPETGKMYPEEEIAHRDWAHVIAYTDLHSVMGVGKDGFVIHPSLIDQAKEGQVIAPDEMKKFINNIPVGQEPKNIPARTFVDRDPLREGYKFDFLNNMSDKVHSKLLGPMVNALSRDPVFLLEYHNAYEALRPMVEKNIITKEQAEVLADTDAITNMSKYVHNPKDKSIFEKNMRVAAPFYFAQNQAWRRALRVLREDPGAFEKYLKLCLGITDYVANASQNGTGVFAIPGTQFIGGIAGFLSGPASSFSNMEFGLSASPASVSSVVPTGSESGMGMLGNIVRPAWGPIVTVGMKEARHWLNLDNVPLANKYLETFLGKISYNASNMSELFPSTFGRNVTDSVLGIFGHTNSKMGSIANQVMNEAMDNLYSSMYDQVYNEISAATSINAQQKVELARSIADVEFSKKMSNPGFKQQFLDKAKHTALIMFITKSVVGFGAPVAVSLQENFSKYPKFNAILQEKKADGSPKYTFQEAMKHFAEKYPKGLLDVVAHTKSSYEPYPETKQALDLLSNHPEVVQKYPYASAYVINRDGAFNPAAYQLELSMHLRDREAPNDYYNSLMTAVGNDYFYNYLQPMYPDTGNNPQSIKNYKALQNAAKNYGDHSNPTWYADHSGGQRAYSSTQAATQMAVMVGDPSVPDSVFGGYADRQLFKVLMESYDVTVSQYDAAGTSKEKSGIAQDWYNKMQIIAPNFPKQSYFITGVLASLAAKEK